VAPGDWSAAPGGRKPKAASVPPERDSPVPDKSAAIKSFARGPRWHQGLGPQVKCGPWGAIRQYSTRVRQVRASRGPGDTEASAPGLSVAPRARLANI
jgi:hypothetical protein